jgi:hypothetical protein
MIHAPGAFAWGAGVIQGSGLHGLAWLLDALTRRDNGHSMAASPHLADPDIL